MNTVYMHSNDLKVVSAGIGRCPCPQSNPCYIYADLEKKNLQILSSTVSKMYTISKEARNFQAHIAYNFFRKSKYSHIFIVFIETHLSQ